MSDAVFRALLKAKGIPQPQAEYRFAPPRRWRFDFAFVAERLALEVDGGIWIAGRHSRGSGLVKEHEKMNEAACRGWRIIRVTPKQLCTPSTVALLKRALEATEAA